MLVSSPVFLWKINIFRIPDFSLARLEYIYKIIQIILQNSRPTCQHLRSGSIIQIRPEADILTQNIKSQQSSVQLDLWDEAISAELNPQHKVEEKQVVR